MARRSKRTRDRHVILGVLASGPARLTFGVAVLVVVAVSLVSGIQAGTAFVPTPIPDLSNRPTLSRTSERLIAVLQSDQLTPEYVSAIGRITERAERTTSVSRVRSVTNTLILVKDGAKAGATPALGPRSLLPIQLTLAERAQLASTGRLGTGDLISADGRTTAIVAELQPSLPRDKRDRAADEFRSVVDTEAAAAGIGITSWVAGDMYTTIAATDGLHSDYLTIVVLACLLPAALALLILRRRVPVAAVLAAGGAALLLSAVLVVNTIGTEAGALPADHPVAQGNRLVNEQLQGTIPIEVEFSGEPGHFRQPEILARIDALANWLRDEYGVKATGLSSTVRDETGIITGVDSVPPNPDDLQSLLEDTAQFDDATFLPSIVTDDYSRTRLIGSWPDHGADAAASMASRFESIAGVELAETGVIARLTAKVPDVEPATTALGNDLGILGAVAIGLAFVLFLVGHWAKHALGDRQAASGARQSDESDDGESFSLFKRHHHEHHRRHGNGPEPTPT